MHLQIFFIWFRSIWIRGMFSVGHGWFSLIRMAINDGEAEKTDLESTAQCALHSKNKKENKKKNEK